MKFIILKNGKNTGRLLRRQWRKYSMWRTIHLLLQRSNTFPSYSLKWSLVVDNKQQISSLICLSSLSFVLARNLLIYSLNNNTFNLFHMRKWLTKLMNTSIFHKFTLPWHKLLQELNNLLAIYSRVLAVAVCPWHPIVMNIAIAVIEKGQVSVKQRIIVAAIITQVNSEEQRRTEEGKVLLMILNPLLNYLNYIKNLLQIKDRLLAKGLTRKMIMKHSEFHFLLIIYQKLILLRIRIMIWIKIEMSWQISGTMLKAGPPDLTSMILIRLISNHLHRVSEPLMKLNLSRLLLNSSISQSTLISLSVRKWYWQQLVQYSRRW